jgi:hypothetical protein
MVHKEPSFIRAGELASLAGVYPDFIKRLVYAGEITDDGSIRHGASIQPIFLSSRLSELLAAIKDYQNRPRVAA